MAERWHGTLWTPQLCSSMEIPLLLCGVKALALLPLDAHHVAHVDNSDALTAAATGDDGPMSATADAPVDLVDGAADAAGGTAEATVGTATADGTADATALGNAEAADGTVDVADGADANEIDTAHAAEAPMTTSLASKEEPKPLIGQSTEMLYVNKRIHDFFSGGISPDVSSVMKESVTVLREFDKLNQ